MITMITTVCSCSMMMIEADYHRWTTLYQFYSNHHTVFGLMRQYVGGRPMGRHNDNRDGREATLVS